MNGHAMRQWVRRAALRHGGDVLGAVVLLAVLTLAMAGCGTLHVETHDQVVVHAEGATIATEASVGLCNAHTEGRVVPPVSCVEVPCTAAELAAQARWAREAEARQRLRFRLDLQERLGAPPSAGFLIAPGRPLILVAPGFAEFI